MFQCLNGLKYWVIPCFGAWVISILAETNTHTTKDPNCVLIVLYWTCVCATGIFSRQLDALDKKPR